jgi:hypothetical protein
MYNQFHFILFTLADLRRSLIAYSQEMYHLTTVLHTLQLFFSVPHQVKQCFLGYETHKH